MDPLNDVEVLELTQMLAGPHVGMHRADRGADGLTVERPGTGEISRNVEPKVGGESYYYLSLNRNKRSVTLDLKSDEGREVFLDLSSDVDVVLENFSPGTVECLGIGYEAVTERNPDVIYCSVSGFGQTGPLRNVPAVGHVIQAFTGIASMTKDNDGHPLRVGIPLSDLAGAMYASQAILAAIRRQDRTGEGDYLDVSLADSMLSFIGLRAGYSHATGEPFPSIARNHIYFAPDTIYETADGYLQVSIVTEPQWHRLCEAINRPALAERTVFETVGDRLENLDDLNAILQTVFAEESTDYWLERLHDNDIPASRLHDTVSVWKDEHTEAREMFDPIDTPGGERFPTSAYPVKHANWDPEGGGRAAALGEDTDAVLRERGYEPSEIERLDEEGII
jgi:crotonobetainyl-CoA:carnitine CoA-transferase CaiB-like acyl-CoA transferase